MTAAIETNKHIEVGFKEKTTQQLQQTFNLKRAKKSKILDQWLSMPYSFSKEDTTYLEKLRNLAEFKIPFWNEDELKLHVIYPLVHRVDYYHPSYGIFAERTISAIFPNNIHLKGKPDLMLATGDTEPEVPYFFFQEYKKEKGTADDPIAQLLSAMLVGQTLNANERPIYGSYVMGRMWFFVVLEGNQFTISNAFVVTLFDHLQAIFAALQNIKIIIERDLMS